MVRGFSYGGTSYAITDLTTNYNRNLISEQGMGLGGEPAIFDGANIVTGSISAAYREDFAPIAKAILDLLSGASSTITPVALIGSDEFGGCNFPTSFINSFEMSLQTKALGTCNMNWVSAGLATSATAASSGTFTNPIPLFWACALTIGGSSTVKSTGFSLKVEVPIDQDYFVIGSKYLEEIIQSGNGTLSGSISFGPKEWTTLQASMGSCGNIGTIVLTLRGQTGSNCATTDIRTLTVTEAVVSDSTFSGQNRTKFTKTLNWKAPVQAAVNNDLFS
ncbi:MAG: phage tail tube protein [Dehalococcoidales bacterium]|jgi:hypothetical protein